MGVVSGKKLLDMLAAHTLHMSITRIVETEIIPQQRAAWFKHATNFTGDVMGHALIEDGTEYGKNEHQVKGPVGEFQLFTINTIKMDVRLFLFSSSNALWQQIHTI